MKQKYSNETGHNTAITYNYLGTSSPINSKKWLDTRLHVESLSSAQYSFAFCRDDNNAKKLLGCIFKTNSFPLFQSSYFYTNNKSLIYLMKTHVVDVCSNSIHIFIY